MDIRRISSLPAFLFLLLLLLLLIIILTPSCGAQSSPNDYLEAHNSARAKVGVGPMTWDDNLAAYAQNYANQRAGDCQLIHSDGPHGENLARGMGSELTGRGAVGMWVREAPPTYEDPCYGGDCGHYSQVVSRNSVRLGCARVRCASGAWLVTCNYSPPGNHAAQPPY